MGDSSSDESFTIDDAAGRGQRLDHLRRLGHLRQPGGGNRLGQALRDNLASIEHVGSRLERHDHRREARHRHGLDLVEERDPHRAGPARAAP